MVGPPAAPSGVAAVATLCYHGLEIEILVLYEDGVVESPGTGHSVANAFLDAWKARARDVGIVPDALMQMIYAIERYFSAVPWRRR